MPREYAVIGLDGKPVRESPARIAELFDAAIKRGEIRDRVAYEFRAGQFVESAGRGQPEVRTKLVQTPHLPIGRLPAAARPTWSLASARQEVFQAEIACLRDRARGLGNF